MKDKVIIGRTTKIKFVDDMKGVPAKIDTGADSSSVWASDIQIDHDRVLHYKLLAPVSILYTGIDHATRDYSVRLVRSSNGHDQIRYSVKLLVVIKGRRVRASFTLADRSRNAYPVLIGCRLLNKKFIVDPAHGVKRTDSDRTISQRLTAELKKDPRAFYEAHTRELLKEEGQI